MLDEEELPVEELLDEELLDGEVLELDEELPIEELLEPDEELLALLDDGLLDEDMLEPDEELLDEELLVARDDTSVGSVGELPQPTVIPPLTRTEIPDNKRKNSRRSPMGCTPAWASA